MAENNAGNSSTMREALIQCELFLSNVSRHAHPTLNPGDKCIACDGVDELRGMVNAALAAPARNCDVGTAKEQAERFKAFCLPRILRCSENSTCPAKHPCNEIGIQYCQLKWAQLPYKEGADKC